jgi:hypothetical protein
LKTVIILSVLFLVTFSSSLAGVVVWPPENASGIVSVYDQYPDHFHALSANGQVWHFSADFGASPHDPMFDPPVPVSEIAWWSIRILVTNNAEIWALPVGEEDWSYLGVFPGAAAGLDENVPAVALGTSASANPSTGPWRLSFELSTGGRVHVDVFDATGRLMRQLMDGPLPAGDHSLMWDGRDDNGRDLPASVYLYRVSTEEGEMTGRIVLAR